MRHTARITLNFLPNILGKDTTLNEVVRNRDLYYRKCYLLIIK